MSRCDPGLLDAIAVALRPLLAVAERQWREQYRLARSVPDGWHGTGASEAAEALFDSLDDAERTLTRIRDTIDTLDAAAQVLRAIGTRMEAAVAGSSVEVGVALRDAAARAVEQVGAVVDSVLDPCAAEPELPQQGPPPVVVESETEPAVEPSILVDPVVAQSDSDRTSAEPSVVAAQPVEPVLLQSNSSSRAPSSAHSRAELAAVGPDDDPSAPILAEAGSW